MNIFFYFSNIYDFFPIILEILCLFIKLFILISFYFNVSTSKRNATFFHILIILATGILTNLSIVLIRLGFPPFECLSPYLFRAIARMELAGLTLQFFSLLTFFKDLSSNKISNYITNFIFIFYKSFLVFYVLFFMGRGLYTLVFQDVSKSYFSHILINIHQVLLLLEGFIALYLIVRNYKLEKVNILKHHIFTLGSFFMTPYLLIKIFESEFIAPTLNFSTTSMIVNLPAATITSLWLTWMIYYCAKKLMGLRFLDINSHVQSKPSEKFNFIDDFKKVLGRLSTISSIEEVKRITQNFFYEAFKVPTDKVQLFIRECKLCEQGIICKCEDNPNKIYIEKFLNNSDENKRVLEIINNEKIMIFDELELTHFYNQDGTLKDDLNFAMNFFDKTKLDLFLPLFTEGKLVAYILVDRGARPGCFYTDVERDELLIYADYLSRVVYLLMNMDLKNILREKRMLVKELYSKDKALSLIKNAASRFIPKKLRSIGVLTYKSGKFVYCNEEAKQLLKINLNEDKGNEITKIISEMGHDAIVFSLSNEKLINNSENEKILVKVTPNIVKDNAIISLLTPTMCDLIKEELKLLSDYKKLEYLIALKTTEDGELINQLIPSNEKVFLNTKLSFLEHVLTKNIIFLNLASENDILSFAQLAYKISGREIFEDISCKHSSDDQSLEFKLFGINPFFNTTGELSVLEKLNGKGMLLLSNITHMTMEMQKKILDFILSGKYTMLKSDESLESDVFLVFSSTQDLKDLVNKGLFLKELYIELQKVMVSFPSLTSVTENEFLSLVEGFREQIIQSKLYQKVLSFSEQDKIKLLSMGCVSLTELKSRIQGILQKRSKRQLSDDELIDSVSNVVDPDLAEAARLGKAVLKDPRLLYLLMQKFNNNQARVASFLDVNRSTISRKCAQYGIVPVVPQLKVKKFKKNRRKDIVNKETANEMPRV